MTVLTLTGGEAGGLAADRAEESRARRRAAVRAADPRGADGHERQRGRHDDRHDRRRDRRDPADAPSTRTPSATSTRTTATPTARRSSPPAASRASSATRRRRRRSSSSRRASSPSTSSSTRKIEAIQAYASQVKVRALPRRGAAAGDRPLLGALRARRATSSRSRSCATATRRRRRRRPPRRSRRRCAMPAEHPRVLVTGAGGPSGISILRALEGAAGHDARGRHRPVRRRPLPRRRRSGARILPRGDDPRFADDLLARCRREAVDVVVPTVDSELLPLARRRAEFADAGVTLVLASEETLETCLDKWALAERCRGHVRVPATVVADAAFDPARRRAAGDRQAALGQRLARDPARRAPRGARGARARRHAARAGAPARPGVLARRARPRRRPRRRASSRARG